MDGNGQVAVYPEAEGIVMGKKVALNKRDRDKIKKRLLAQRAELLADLDGLSNLIYY